MLEETVNEDVAEARRNIARDNLAVFGIKLPKPFFRGGKLTDQSVEVLEKLAPTISTQKIISPEVIGISYLAKSINSLFTIINGSRPRNKKK
ncbi:MAG: hypothetical protein ACD_12C00012G0005 [uncultured bacterium]|nr:MAG: hypothetical protein ACD_12C00012G0005 [uncultured bacterium]